MVLAIAMAFAASLGFGSGSALVRVGTQRVSAPTASFFSVLTSALVAVVPALAIGASDMVGLPWTAYAWFALMGAMAYPFARVLSNTAIMMVGASVAAPLSSLQPLFALALGMTILGERPDILVAVGTPFIVGGLILVITSRATRTSIQQVTSRNNLGYVLAAGASATFASRDVIGRHVVSSLAPPIVASAYALSIGAVMLLAITLPDVVRSLRRVPPQYIAVCALAGVSQGLGVVFLFQALSRIPVTVVSPILGSSPLVTLVLAHFFLGRLESVTPPLVVGTLLSVGGVVLVVLGAGN